MVVILLVDTVILQELVTVQMVGLGTTVVNQFVISLVLMEFAYYLTHVIAVRVGVEILATYQYVLSHVMIKVVHVLAPIHVHVKMGGEDDYVTHPYAQLDVIKEIVQVLIHVHVILVGQENHVMLN